MKVVSQVKELSVKELSVKKLSGRETVLQSLKLILKMVISTMLIILGTKLDFAKLELLELKCPSLFRPFWKPFLWNKKRERHSPSSKTLGRHLFLRWMVWFLWNIYWFLMLNPWGKEIYIGSPKGLANISENYRV